MVRSQYVDLLELIQWEDFHLWQMDFTSCQPKRAENNKRVILQLAPEVSWKQHDGQILQFLWVFLILFRNNWGTLWGRPWGLSLGMRELPESTDCEIQSYMKTDISLIRHVCIVFMVMLWHLSSGHGLMTESLKKFFYYQSKYCTGT